MEEEDDFWKENKYFGKIENVQSKVNEEESDEEFDEKECKNAKDIFDSDFKDSSEAEDSNNILESGESDENRNKNRPIYLMKKTDIIKFEMQKQ